MSLHDKCLLVNSVGFVVLANFVVKIFAEPELLAISDFIEPKLLAVAEPELLAVSGLAAKLDFSSLLVLFAIILRFFANLEFFAFVGFIDRKSKMVELLGFADCFEALRIQNQFVDGCAQLVKIR